ncbi:Uncharacterised protein [Salmonella enterica]|uniref:Uncharacterized protein n=1 Tax=Salmonella enterica TaxID=28901 RepID=A0A379QKE6_SALER|nr:Uncharacterised protein [Salmonella enterica]
MGWPMYKEAIKAFHRLGMSLKSNAEPSRMTNH